MAFTAGADGGSAITNYKYSTDGGSSFTAVSPAATTSPITITGLSNGTSYNVQILAVNAIGDGTATASTAATPRTTPGAPTGLSVTPGNGQLTASFTAPASNGGSAITNYEYSTNGGSSFTAVSPASTSTSIVITSLLNGTSYNVQVRAVNAAGSGSATTSVAATPRTTPGAPTITGITPGNGQLSVAFTAPASNGGASITNYEYSLNGGSTWVTPDPAVTSSPLLITGLTNGTTYDVQIRAVNSAGSGTATASTSGTPAAPASPTITVTPATFTSALSTTYGTESSTANFTVSGSTLSGNLTVTPPSGVEVSLSSGTGFADTLTLTASSGSVSATTVYARLKATAAAGNYNSASISVSGGGATAQSVATSSSDNTVAPKAVTITGLSATGKVYDGTTSVTISGTAAYSGLANGESHSVTNSVTWTFPDKNIGTGKVLSRSASYTAPNANYSLSTQPSLTADITAKELTGSFTANNKAFDNSTTATVATRAVSGKIGSEDVNHTGGTATFADVNVGTSKTVTLAGATLTGADAGNYTLTSVSTTTANITQGAAAITFGALPAGKKVGDAAFSAGATTTLGTISYSSANTAVATVNASTGSITLVAPGVTTITATVAGTANFTGATASQTLNVAAAGETNTILSENFASLTSGGDTATTGAGSPGTTAVTTNLTTNFPSSVQAYQAGGAVKLGTGSLSGSITSRTLNLSANGGVYSVVFSVKGWTTVEGDLLVSAGSVTNTNSYTNTISGAYRTITNTFSNGTSTSTITFATTAKRAFLDDITVSQTTAAVPAITPSGTFPALTTTYGTPASSSNSVLVSGGSLTNDITATAPANFQVSADNTNWASTATYTNSGGFASGSLFLRLASNAAAQTYSNQVVTLTSGGASNQTVAIANSTVSRYPITVGAVATNKVYGAADPALTYTNASLLFSDTFSGSISRTAGTNAGTYTIQQGTLTNANYDITFLTNAFTITPKALSITANNVSKAFGVTLTSPQTGSTAFSSSGLVSGESISSVTITYTDGAGSGAAAGTYTGAVVPSDPVGINTNNYSITYNAGNLTVDAAPTITLGTSSFPAFSTTYGTPSSTQNFTVTGGNLTGDVTVTAPAGFVVSTNASSGFASSLILTSAANAVPSTTIYVQIPGTANASTNYSGNISVTSDGATTRNVSIAASTVSPKSLTIGGLSASNRVYDATTNGTVSGTPVYVGLTNSESFSVTNTVSWFFANKSVGTNKAQSASANFTAPSANYNVTPQPTFAADITPATLTLSGAAATSRAYVAGNTNVTITGTLSGVLGSDTVGFTGTGSIASANAGTNIPVTANVTLTGADAGNYSLTQPTGLTVNITKASQTITFGALSNVTAGTTNALSATVNSGLPLTYTSANTNVATISGSNVVAVAPGVTTITASQAGDSNFEAAASVSRTLNVAAAGGGVSEIIPKLYLLSRNTPSGTNGWTIVNATTDNASTDYWKMVSNNAVLTTPSFNLDNYSAESCVLKLGTFGTVTASNQTITVSISTNNGSSWSTLTNQTPTTSSSTAMAAIDLSGFAGTQVQLRFANTNGTTSIGVRFFEALITGSSPVSPAITPSGTFGALSATYGTPSSSSNSVLVSGGSLTNDITATAPSGFELSTNGSSWATNATFTQTDGFASGSLFLRLASNAAAQTYSNQVVALTSGSASNSIAIANSSVSQKALTVTAVAKSKVFGAADPALTYSTDGLVGADSLTGSLTRAAGENVGTYAINQGTLANANYSISFTGANLTITAATLPAVSWGTSTITNSNGVTSFSYLYTGRNSNAISTTYSNSLAPTNAGYYTVVATSTDGNYSGSSTNDYWIAGPIAGADTITKPAVVQDFTYKVSDLLLNDQRIHTNGAVLTSNLSITNVISGTASVELDGADVLISRGTNATTAFSYTLVDSVTGLSTTGNVSVETGGSVGPFNLQIVRLVSGPTGNTNTATTTMVLDFIGVPNNSYAMEWSPNLTNWVSIGTNNTGVSGSFTVTNTVSGIYTNRGFFRATVSP